MPSNKTLKYLLKSGKNSKLTYYAKNFIGLMLPDVLFRMRRKHIIDSLGRRKDRDYILSRVDYYCHTTPGTPLAANSPTIKEFHRKGHNSVYFFDSYQYIRYFPIALRWRYMFGDVVVVPDEPAIVKSRPLRADNGNSVLLNMDKVRHFIFLDDTIDFEDKQNKAVFRGELINKPRRISFMERWFGSECCDCGDVGRHAAREEWRTGMITLYDHLNYKFVVALEGNDVASNLKWVMSSNSIAIMPQPTCETWFMEGRLIPNYHYIEIKADYSDLQEKIAYYSAHPEEAKEIISHAHEWVRQFFDRKRERLISLLVLDKYFRMTQQGELLAKQ